MWLLGQELLDGVFRAQPDASDVDGEGAVEDGHVRFVRAGGGARVGLGCGFGGDA